MLGPVWARGALARVRYAEGRPLAWRVRLDDPITQRDATAATLSPRETETFSHVPDAPWRMLRRRLAKALIAQVAACHPDQVSIERDPLGAVRIVAPIGWHLSLAGQPPHALIGLHRDPIGVDIEPWDAPAPPADAFSGEELEMLDNLWDHATDHARLRGWVAKEAHGKACGRARKLDPRDIQLHQHAGSVIGESAGVRTSIHIAFETTTIAAVAVPVPPVLAPKSA